MKLKLWWKWLGHPQKGAAPLSFVTPTAYDYGYLPPVIRSYYPIADEIVLGLDKDRISWSGKPYPFDEKGFRTMVEQLDPQKKIKIIEGNFHSFSFPMDNDTYERNYLSMECKKNNWIIQIDSDETLLNPQVFKNWIEQGNGSGCLLAHWYSVFKKIGNDLLVVDREDDVIDVGTRLHGGYIGSRVTGQNKILSPLKLVHFNYGRTEEELRTKLEHWSHSTDLDSEKFIERWKSIDLDNYLQFTNLLPFGDSRAWPGLKLVREEEWLQSL